ncbi:MAG: ABC transporter substrate binding protein, partial [Nitriliruptor sp.]|uniref:ABC transporter substrate binding protein n=1 Tax=Nitriliruptor sp. TaxID=2448056 RepID=UPI00349FF95B
MRDIGARGVAAVVALAALFGCAPIGPDPAAAQPPLVLVLRSVPDPADDPFVDELRAQRLVPGRDLILEPAGPRATYPDEAAVTAAFDELDREPAVIVAYSTPYAQLATERYPDVPTVSVVNDPVASGLVADRDAPEGNITGVTFATPADRTLELAAQVTGGDLDRIGHLIPADDPAVIGPRRRLRVAAGERGTEVVEAFFSDPGGIGEAVATLVAAEVDAVLLGASNTVVASLAELETAFAATSLPVIANNGRIGFAVAVLEPDGGSVRRQVAVQVARLL